MNDNDKFLRWLQDQCNYITPVFIEDHDMWVAVEQLIFHGSLIVGDMHDYVSIPYRYCYRNTSMATAAMVEWIMADFEGEPKGWHKRRCVPIDCRAHANRRRVIRDISERIPHD